jgi:hypothetical protein
MFAFKDAFLSPLSKTKLLLPFAPLTPRHPTIDNPDFCQEKGLQSPLTASSWQGVMWGPQTVSQGFLWGDERGHGTRRVSPVCVALPITIWIWIGSNLEETHLKSKLRMQGPEISTITIATRGPSKGKNQVRDGSQDFVSLSTCPAPCIFIDCSFNHLALLRTISVGVSTYPEVFLHILQEVLASAHNPLCWTSV